MPDGDFTVDSRSRSDARWIVTYTVSDGPIAYYLYERPARQATLLFVRRPKLTEYRLARMEPVEFPARDGLRLYGYLTLPPGREPRNLPLVLLVHGGPWARDVWGYDRDVQWLAHRVRGAAGELPRVHRVREGLPQRRRPRVGRQDADRRARRLPSR